MNMKQGWGEMREFLTGIKWPHTPGGIQDRN